MQSVCDTGDEACLQAMDYGESTPKMCSGAFSGLKSYQKRVWKIFLQTVKWFQGSMTILA